MYKKISHIVVNTLLLALLVGLFGCASKKKKSDNPSLMKKFRQNTTAYYNGYFNAEEILFLTYKDLESSHVDNFNNIIPLYPTMTDDVKGHKSELERANEKLIAVANDHEISHWRDDCYVMIGEIQFLLKDYESAEETFEYFMQEFDPLSLKNRKLVSKSKSSSDSKSRKEKIKERSKKSKNKSKSKKRSRSKKKKDSKKTTETSLDSKETEAKTVNSEPNTSKSGLFGHTPAYYDGMLWMARTYIERGKPTLALSLINRLEERQGLDEKIIPKLRLAKTHYYIQEDRYDKAIVQLMDAIKWTKSKKSQARYWFVLGQIQMKSGNYKEASASFEHVIKLKPVYEMHLNAELNQIKSQFHDQTGDIESVDKKLNKMLKDGKNEAYQGEIYYALGGLYLSSDDQKKAMEYYNLAIRQGENKSQKMEAYLSLAELNYLEENYVEAKSYFDSTLIIMNKEDHRYLSTKKKANSLSEIASNLSIINLQDSLLKVSSMSHEEKLALARKIQKEEEDKLALEKEENVPSMVSKNQNPFQLGGLNQLPGSNASNFFAYSPVLLAKGKKEFKRKWGNRILEDNWRRESKSIVSFDDSEDIIEESEESSGEINDKDLIRKYLSGIPQSAKQKQVANDKIEKAMFELGKLYRDKLGSNIKCIETLEQLLSRFPNTQYKPTSYYYLHLAYKDRNISDKSKMYADKLIKEIPESLFAKLLKDPNFIDKWLKEQNKLGNYYDKTYTLFSQGEYQNVKTRISEVESLFGPDNKYATKFAMLNAMTEGSLTGKEGYIAGMKDFIAKYPGTPESTRAKEILRFLRGDKGAFNDQVSKGTTDFPQYSFDEDEMHYLIVVVHDIKSSSLSKLKIDISQFNRKYHKKDKLKMSSLDLDLNNSTPVIMIRKFRDKELSMAYYKSVIRKRDKFITKDVQYDVYAISQRNYREVIKEKTVNSYMKFFELKYLESQ